MRPLSPTELSTLRCDRCGGSLRDGYEARDHGTDPGTGAHDVEFLCSGCVSDESYQREPVFCTYCDCRITGEPVAGLCPDCDAAFANMNGPDILEIAKAGCEAER